MMRRAAAMALLWAAVLAASLGGAVEAGGMGPVRVATTVRAVRMYVDAPGSGCRIELANGRRLEQVWGAECAARPGQHVMLWYVQECRWLVGCRQRLWMWQLMP